MITSFFHPEELEHEIVEECRVREALMFRAELQETLTSALGPTHPMDTPVRNPNAPFCFARKSKMRTNNVGGNKSDSFTFSGIRDTELGPIGLRSEHFALGPVKAKNFAGYLYISMKSHKIHQLPCKPFGWHPKIEFLWKYGRFRPVMSGNVAKTCLLNWNYKSLKGLTCFF